MLMRNVLHVLFVLLAYGFAVSAQTSTGSISGRITDPSGAAVAGVEVSLTRTDTSESRRAQTSEGGYYVFPLLVPGDYVVEAAQSGFQKLRRSLKLDVSQAAVVDLVLVIGDVNQSVEVTAEAPPLETGSASLGQVVDNKRIAELPTNGRNSYSFATLVPGVRASAGFRQVSYNLFNEQFISINGSRPNQNAFLLDGGSNTNSSINGPGFYPPIDMVQEYKVQTNNLSAEFSNTTGGAVNVVTKSGSNQVHGSVYEFFRHDKLTANDFFLNRAGRQEPAFRFNQFGLSLGGPVVIPKLYNGRNKTFFFGAYEGLRWIRGMTAAGTMPTALERSGDFSQSRNAQGQVVTVYDPLTTRPDPDRPGRLLRTPFPGNRIPENRIDPVARNLARLAPLPNTPGNPVSGANNWIASGSSPIVKDTWSIRVDHNFTDSQKTFLRYSTNDSTQERPAFYGQDLWTSTPVNGSDLWQQRQVTLNHTAVLSPTVVLELSSSFLRYYLKRRSGGYNYDPVQLGFPEYMRQVPLTPCFPGVSVTGMGFTVNVGDVGGGYLGSCQGQGNSFDTFHEYGNLTIVRGSHTLKAGGTFGSNRKSARNFLWANHSYQFTPGFTQGPDPLVASAGAGLGTASFLLGIGSGNIRSDGPGQNLQHLYMGGYFQDDWKVTPKLTLNLGLRYDYLAPWTERFNRITMWDGQVQSSLGAGAPSLTGGLAFPGADGASRYLFDPDRNNWAPRFGFAYSLTPKTVIRGGYGIFFGPIDGGAFNNDAIPRSGFEATTSWLSSIDGFTPTNYLSNPYPNGFERAPGSSLGARTLLGQNVVAMDQNRVTPSAQQWNLGFQRSLPAAFTLDVAYAGSRGQNLFGALNYNQLANELLSQGAALQQQVTNPYFGFIQTGALSARTVQRGQLLRPYPQFTGVITPNHSYGASTYHSLQLKADRRFSKGLSLLASYTFSKLMDDVPPSILVGGFPGEPFSAGGIQDFYNRRNERAVAAFDTPHYLNVTGLWDLPIGKGRQFLTGGGVLAGILGGWQINTIASIQSGAPLGMTTASNTLGNYGSVQRPNWSGQSPEISGDAGDRVDRWFNTAAFSLPAPFTFGNTPRLIANLRGPHMANLDLSIFKRIPIREGINLQFRSEFFNIMNRAQFAIPNTSIGSPAAGTITSMANQPRDIQFALRLAF
jgi:hypothetical protein